MNSLNQNQTTSGAAGQKEDYVDKGKPSHLLSLFPLFLSLSLCFCLCFIILPRLPFLLLLLFYKTA